ncbi:MAG TPA: hypothetical protein VFW16_12575 [Streptosporangiaceae bacterium]|nr:hypothetical protein [Streptosporangiaceae bacterium]
MTQTVWDVSGDVRKALRSIVGDPQLGTAVLADPHVMANLLKDLLPDLPRESALLVAAARCDLVGLLTGHLGQGLDLGTSSRLAAGWFAERMPFTDDACTWVVAELAIALGADPSMVIGATLADTVPAGPQDLFEATAGMGTVTGWGDNDEGEIDVPAGMHHVVCRRRRLVPQRRGDVERTGPRLGQQRRRPHQRPRRPRGRDRDRRRPAAQPRADCRRDGGRVGEQRVRPGPRADRPLGRASVSAGAEHSLAVADGRVIAWGGKRLRADGRAARDA